MKKTIFVIIIIMLIASCESQKSETNFRENYIGDWVLYKHNGEMLTIEEMQKMISDKNILTLKKLSNEILYEKESSKLEWNDDGYMKIIGENGISIGKMNISENGVLNEQIFNNDGENYLNEYKKVEEIMKIQIIRD